MNLSKEKKIIDLENRPVASPRGRKWEGSGAWGYWIQLGMEKGYHWEKWETRVKS